MRAGTREQAERFLLDLVEVYRSRGRVAVLEWLADHPRDEPRVVAAVNRLAGYTWRWAYPDRSRMLDYVAFAAAGWPLAERSHLPIVAPKRRRRVAIAASEGGRP